MKDKHDQVRRYLKGAKKHLDREERQRLEEHVKRRRTTRRKKTPRRRSWDEVDEDDEEYVDFEPIVRAPQLGDVARGLSVAEAGAGRHGLAEGVVFAVHGARVRLILGGAEVVADVVSELAAGGLVVGDRVAVESPAPDRLRVVAREPRRSVLERTDPRNPRARRALAANVDLGVIVLPAGPGRPRPGLVDRVWLALARGGVEACLAINKVDLLEQDEARRAVEEIAETFTAAGLGVHLVSAADGTGIDGLRSALVGRTVVFAGHSGGGKSSILNRLDPGGARPVGDVRQADGKGRHTTTVSGLRVLEDGTRLVDTPGVREFGVEAPTPEDLEQVFPDLLAFGPCRYSDCSHVDDAGCAVAEAATDDGRLAGRLAAYRRILASLDDG